MVRSAAQQPEKRIGLLDLEKRFGALGGRSTSQRKREFLNSMTAQDF
jgi:hypothetical protein